jgi:hypothetical protein
VKGKMPVTEQKDGEVIERREKGDLAPGTYRIGQDAIDVCNELRMVPKDTIVWQAQVMKNILNESDMKKIVNDSVRQVVQVEGVKLHKDQKLFFQELFAGLMDYLRGGGK